MVEVVRVYPSSLLVFLFLDLVMKQRPVEEAAAQVLALSAVGGCNIREQVN